MERERSRSLRICTRQQAGTATGCVLHPTSRQRSGRLHPPGGGSRSGEGEGVGRGVASQRNVQRVALPKACGFNPSPGWPVKNVSGMALAAGKLEAFFRFDRRLAPCR